jgi:hypothetical protein
MCLYIHVVQSFLVQMQPDVRLGGPDAPVLGACGLLTILCPLTDAAQVSVIRVSIYIVF